MNTVNNEVCEFDSTPTTENFFKTCKPGDSDYFVNCASKCGRKFGENGFICKSTD
jgi:hypothetical protein